MHVWGTVLFCTVKRKLTYMLRQNTPQVCQKSHRLCEQSRNGLSFFGPLFMLDEVLFVSMCELVVARFVAYYLNMWLCSQNGERLMDAASEGSCLTY